MPTTTRQLSKIANVAEQTVRNYTREYAELLSPAARGETGPRLFSDEDVQTICTVAALRREGVPPAEVLERARRGDVYVDATTDHTKPHQATQEATNRPQAYELAHNSLQRQIEALQRAQRVNLRRALWSHGVAFYLGMVTAGVIFFATWWLVNGR